MVYYGVLWCIKTGRQGSTLPATQECIRKPLKHIRKTESGAKIGKEVLIRSGGGGHDLPGWHVQSTLVGPGCTLTRVYTNGRSTAGLHAVTALITSACTCYMLHYSLFVVNH